MKATCMQEHLARGLATVNRAVATRTPMPILANILLETSDSRLKLSATNLEIGISCWIAAEVEAEGATTVPGWAPTQLLTMPGASHFHLAAWAYDNAQVALAYDAGGTQV